MPRSGPNKTAFWRKTPKQLNPETNKIERYGRRLKYLMGGANHPGIILPIHVSLMKRAGISTPEFDKRNKVHHNISDVNIIKEPEHAII